jgi:UDP-glucose 4,6-dehydratase
VKKYPQYKIVNFDKLDYCSCLKNLEEISAYPNYTFVKGDIGSSDLVNYVLKMEKVDTIMHFAAQTHVGKCSLVMWWLSVV